MLLFDIRVIKKMETAHEIFLVLFTALKKVELRPMFMSSLKRIHFLYQKQHIL